MFCCAGILCILAVPIHKTQFSNQNVHVGTCILVYESVLFKIYVCASDYSGISS